MKIIFCAQFKKDLGGTKASETAREPSLLSWQSRWDQETRGRWTARLIAQLSPWLERRHGDVNFYLTKLLTGHGYFRSYLHSMGKAAGPECLYCASLKDDALHTFFTCERWRDEQASLGDDVDWLTPDDVISYMLAREKNWTQVTCLVESILGQKRADLQ